MNYEHIVYLQVKDGIPHVCVDRLFENGKRVFMTHNELSQTSGDKEGFELMSKAAEWLGNTLLIDSSAPRGIMCIRVRYLVFFLLIFAQSLAQADKRVSECEEDYNPIERGVPVYPSMPYGKPIGHSGEVKILVFISPDGSVYETEIVETSNRLFDRTSIGAVKNNRYKTRLNHCTKLEKLVFELE